MVKLDLSDRRLDSAGLKNLLASGGLAGVTDLNLEANDLEDSGFGIGLLAECADLRSVGRIRLRNTGVSEAGLAALGASPYLGRLAALDLRDNFLSESAIGVLVRAAWFTQLRELELCINSFGDAGVKALVTIGPASQLVKLGLGQVGMTDDGLEVLADSPFVSRLTRLDLSNYAEATDSNNLTDRGLTALAASRYLGQLADLKFHEAGIGVPGVEKLLCSPNLAGLRSLSINDCWNISLRQKEQLQEQYSDHVCIE